MAKGDAGCMKTGNHRSFEIEIPEECDSREVLKNILGKISERHVGDDGDDESCCEEQEDVCTETSSEDCMSPAVRKAHQREDPKSIKKKHKDQAKKRKALQKECKKKAKEIVKDFKLKEKQRRRKEKERMKKIKRYEKQKDKEEKKCRKERKKCEKDKEKVRRAKEKEKLRTLKERMKMKCDSLKYAKASDCEEDDYTNCLVDSRNATKAATAKDKMRKCCQ